MLARLEVVPLLVVVGVPCVGEVAEVAEVAVTGVEGVVVDAEARPGSIDGRDSGGSRGGII